MLKKIYMVLAATVLGFYAVGAQQGWEFGNPERKVVAADARRSPGWSHAGTMHFWHRGYSGGK